MLDSLTLKIGCRVVCRRVAYYDSGNDEANHQTADNANHATSKPLFIQFIHGKGPFMA